MPPKGKKKAPPSAPIIHPWMEVPEYESFTDDQKQFFAKHPESAMPIIDAIRKQKLKGPLPPVDPTSPPDPICMALGNFRNMLPSTSTAAQSDIESSILGKQPQVPSPAPSMMLSSSPARIQINQNMEDPPSPSPAPRPLRSRPPVHNWDVYFNNLESALSGLDINHSQTPRYLGTMLTGLQSLLRDSRYLSLQVDGGFSIADLLDSLPHTSREASTPPPPVPAPMPKPHVKRTRVSPPTPSLAPKQSAPAKAAAAPLLNKRPPPSEAPAVSISINPAKRTTH